MENLWTSLLRESSKRSRVLPDSKVFVCGDSGCGKSTLLDKVCNPSHTYASNFANNNADDLGKKFVEYNYLELDDSMVSDSNDGTGIALSSSPVHMWAYDVRAFGNNFDYMQSITKQDKVVFCIKTTPKTFS